MKLQIVTLKLDLSDATRQRLMAAAQAAVLLLGATIAYGDVPHSFQKGELLTADALNQNFADLDARVNMAAPPGALLAFAGSSVPNGWMLCDGSALKSSAHSALFAAIGTGWGDGSAGPLAGSGTDFNLPDLRGQFLRGVDDGAGRDPDAANRTSATNGATGDAVGSLEGAATAQPLNMFMAASAGNHTHDYNDNSGWDSCGTPSNTDCSGPESGNRQEMQRTTLVAGAHTHTITGGDSETRPRNAAVHWIIKD